jgi:hypothetical protein
LIFLKFFIDFLDLLNNYNYPNNFIDFLIFYRVSVLLRYLFKLYFFTDFLNNYIDFLSLF